MTSMVCSLTLYTPGSLLGSWTATPRPLFQPADGPVQLAHGRVAVARMVLFEVIARRLLASSEYAYLSAQHLFQAGVHFFLFNELAPVGLRDTFPDGGAEAGLFLKQAQGCVLDQPLGVCAGVSGDRESCVSCSGVKCTSIPSRYAKTFE